MVSVEVLRTDLLAARKARDTTAQTAIKRAMGRIESAEAPPAVPVSSSVTEVDRLTLTEAELRGCLQAEIDEALEAASMYEAGGRHSEAAQLRAEAAVLDRYLTSP
jgi:uncharacterized protein YqeY